MKFGGLIFEGVSGSGKSTLFRRLTRDDMLLANDAGLYLSQSYTLRMCDPADPERLANALLSTLEQFRDGYLASEFAQRTDRRGSFGFVMESFHYYLAFDYVQEARQTAFIGHFDERLLAVGARLVLLTVQPDAVIENCVRSTLRSRGPGWAEFLKQYGKTDEALALHFTRRQTRLEEMAAASRLPIQRIDTTRGDWDEAMKAILEFAAD
jgi:hypothetical protein